MVIGAVVCAGSSARAQEVAAAESMTEMAVPGGLNAALQVMGDRIAADRSRFFVEVIQRIHDTAPGARKSQGDILLQTLLSHLDRTAQTPAPLAPSPPVNGDLAGAGTSAAGRETVPLPLSSRFWIDTVFSGRATADTLAPSILRSRTASLLYHALLSLDDETRVWFAGQPALVAEVMHRSIGAFVVAAPALRISRQVVQVPGGDAARPAWEALVGRPASEPLEFVRAALTMSEGRLAYFINAIGQLTPAQTAFVLKLDAADSAVRVDAARRLFAIFDRNAAGWKLEERPFWRPRVDPAMLVADLATDGDGRPHVPGTRTFWSILLNGADDPGAKQAAGTALLQGEPADFVWLCEQVFKGSQVVQRRPFEIVLFASRVLKDVPPEHARDALDAVRGATHYPALAMVLERARLTDVSVYAIASRRAARLTAIDDTVRAARAIAQFQGAVAVLTRAAARGAITPGFLARSIASLSAIDVSDRGDYEGRLVRWLTETIAAHDQASGSTERGSVDADAVGRVDERVVQMVSGETATPPQFVEWEGTRYRLDFARAEALRLASTMGEQAQPYLSIAAALVGIADALGHAPLAQEAVRAESARLAGLSEMFREDVPQQWTDSDGPLRLRAAADSLANAAKAGNLRDSARLAPALLLIADDLLARGLMQVVYAVALGQRERSMVSAGDAASRHDFGLRLLGFGRLGVWRYPTSGSDRTRDWRVTGSLLGLDLRLADFALVPLSARPPLRPTINEADRRVFVETAVLLQPAQLADADRDAMLAAIARGRERLDTIRSRADAAAVAREIRIGAVRRTLLEWMVAHDRERLPHFFSPTELLWLGLDGAPLPAPFHAWGTSAEPRAGCDCLQLVDRRSWESLAGRWDSGILATAFADLNLRLAEVLRELRMPAALLSHVLSAAALDFINNAVSRWQDDHRALLAFVQALPVDRVEQYLALLTTNGPLVAVGHGSEESNPPGRTGVPR